MYVVTSLAFHALVTATAVLIGWSTEVRGIVRTRANLVAACRADGTDHHIAFEIAGVDRDGVERRLIAAGCTAALINGVAFFPGQLIAGEFRDAFGWSLDMKTRFGALVGLATTVVWSGLRVRRGTPVSATM
ncbi:MAG: hypothetical protein FGM42_05000 [Ilumatobacteraceae bacterium]|nr:hypothetical protein [Ilumatobacteraceae bacterium]